MGRITYPGPVKLIFSMISAHDELFLEAKSLLTHLFGKIDMESGYQEFGYTTYYEEEMGAGLKQKLVSFAQLIIPERLGQIKHESNCLELELSRERNQNIPVQDIRRKINFDPGYLTLSKFILASTKNGPARIYLKKGIYAEITLRFMNKSFRPLEWTYRNYQTDGMISYLNLVREEYRKQIHILNDTGKNQ